MSSLSTFFGGSTPVGTLVQATYTLTDPAFLPANGAKVLRTTYPLFAATQPSVNTFTYTSRNRGVATNAGAIAAHAGLWVMAGANGLSSIQTTPDGITFTQRSVPSSDSNSLQICSLISDGTNVVGVGTTTNGVAGFWSTDGMTFNRSVSSVACALSSMQCVMAYAATLGTVGRFIVANGGTGFFTSDDRGVTWTFQSHGLGVTVFSIAWTGAKFIALSNYGGILTSTTGLAGSWVSQTLFTVNWSGASVNQGSIASDGAGRVVISNTGVQNILVSQDHGVSWMQRNFTTPGVTSGNSLTFNEVSFTNGLFFIAQTNGSLIVSKDTVSWVIPPDLILSRFETTALTAFSYKAGVYFAGFLGGSSAATTAITIVEDTTKIYLPLVNQQTPSNANTLTYVKVA